MTPLSGNERQPSLDALRGMALFGVLWINLLTVFRVSLFEHIAVFHTHPGALNEWIDLVSTWLFEFKAFTVFSFLFGVGTRIQAERTSRKQTNAAAFLLRRFGVLLAIGIVHMFLIWNGDILCLYAICGILSIPFIRLPAWIPISLGIAAISFSFAPINWVSLPTEKMMRTQAAVATQVYANGNYLLILILRWHETWDFMLPLLLSVLPKTFGLMLLGMAAWRKGLLREPAKHRRFLAGFFVIATVVGAFATSLIFWSAISGKALPLSSHVVDALSYIPMALGLTAGFTLWFSNGTSGTLVSLFAAVGRMALSNYLAQSVVFSLIFYGYGLQQFGKLAPAPAAFIGLTVFGVQLIASREWLRRYQFGPMEWLWRSLTYGRRQPFRHTPR
ncbi:MAG: DUF418 domain-containing protein [Luteolibacter sp.]